MFKYAKFFAHYACIIHVHLDHYYKVCKLGTQTYGMCRGGAKICWQAERGKQFFLARRLEVLSLALNIRTHVKFHLQQMDLQGIQHQKMLTKKHLKIINIMNYVLLLTSGSY